jgi:F-type H+-transporting ATPase subunit alpha
MEEQVVVIFAATKGYLTKIETPRLQEWSHSFIAFLREKHPEIIASIKDTNALSDDNATALVSAIEEFNKSF